VGLATLASSERSPEPDKLYSHPMKPTVILHSSLTPDAFAEALRRAIDTEHWTFFSLSGYEGTRPILGEVHAQTFRLQKRRISRNDFAGHFFGQVEPEPSGARIEGYFAAPPWARYFMKVWVVLAVICGGPVLVMSLRDALTGHHEVGGDLWVGIVVPAILIFVGTVLPRITQRFGRGDRKMMIEFVEEVGSAKAEDIESAVCSTYAPW
jgi:hypothetical protein